MMTPSGNDPGHVESSRSEVDRSQHAVLFLSQIVEQQDQSMEQVVPPFTDLRESVISTSLEVTCNVTCNVRIIRITRSTQNLLNILGTSIRRHTLNYS